MGKQNEITESSNLFDENSSLVQRGWARKPILKYNKENIGKGWLRIKEWDHYSILNKQFGFQLTIGDIGYLTQMSYVWLDFENLFVIPSNNNAHPDHQATHDIAINVAQEIDLNDLKFYIYALYNTLKAQGENLIKIRIGDLRLKVYQALKLHKSQFYTYNMGWQAEAMKERRRERFGYYYIKDKGKFYNF